MMIRSYKCCITIKLMQAKELILLKAIEECMICHFWFFNHEIKFQGSVYNGCRNLTILSVNMINIAIIAVKDVDHSCIIHNICKSGAINLLKNYVLENRVYI